MLPKQLLITASVVIGLLVLAEGEELECGGGRVTVRGRCYEEELLVEDVLFAKNFIVDWHTNVLYFIGYFRFPISPRLSYEVDARYLDLDTKKIGIVHWVSVPSAFAVDQKKHEVYVYGNEDIYKLHCNNETAERVGSVTLSPYNSRSMSFKDELYYINGEKSVCTMINGVSAKVADMNGTLASTYVIDEDGYQYFRYGDALYGKMRGSEAVDVYKTGLKVGEYVGGVKMDLNGMPYMCEDDKLYFVNKDKIELERVGTFNDNCTEVAFDKDNNIIYSTPYEIKKLKAVDLSVVRHTDE